MTNYSNSNFSLAADRSHWEAGIYKYNMYPRSQIRPGNSSVFNHASLHNSSGQRYLNSNESGQSHSSIPISQGQGSETHFDNMETQRQKQSDYFTQNPEGRGNVFSLVPILGTNISTRIEGMNEAQNLQHGTQNQFNSYGSYDVFRV